MKYILKTGFNENDTEVLYRAKVDGEFYYIAIDAETGSFGPVDKSWVINNIGYIDNAILSKDGKLKFHKNKRFSDEKMSIQLEKVKDIYTYVMGDNYKLQYYKATSSLVLVIPVADGYLYNTLGQNINPYNLKRVYKSLLDLYNKFDIHYFDTKVQNGWHWGQEELEKTKEIIKKISVDLKNVTITQNYNHDCGGVLYNRYGLNGLKTVFDVRDYKWSYDKWYWRQKV